MPSATTKANGIEIAYETFGSEEGRPLLLVMGLGGPMLVWHPDFCRLLADKGFFVVRYDNRDVGLSTHLHDAPPPNLMAGLMGDTSSASYTLDDMADDGRGLLEALDIGSAHVVGVSLGGMIAQVMAVRHPATVRSLTSISSTPSPLLSNPTAEVMSAMMLPPPSTRQETLDRMLSLSRVAGSPAYPIDEEWLTDLAGQMWDRGRDAMGIARQTMAIYASGDRTEAVRQIQAPALVIHGDKDPMINVAAGQATASAIPGAELLVLPGMGHDLPRALWPTIVDAISALARRAESVPSPEPA